jgi:hypothetical protein
VMVLTTSRRKVSKPPRFACINKKNRDHIASTIPSSRCCEWMYISSI